MGRCALHSHLAKPVGKVRAVVSLTHIQAGHLPRGGFLVLEPIPPGALEMQNRLVFNMLLKHPLPGNFVTILKLGKIRRTHFLLEQNLIQSWIHFDWLVDNEIWHGRRCFHIANEALRETSLWDELFYDLIKRFSMNKSLIIPKIHLWITQHLFFQCCSVQVFR